MKLNFIQQVFSPMLKRRHRLCIILIIITLNIDYGCKSSTSEKSNGDPSSDFLSVPGPIRLIDRDYFLAWSSHPSDTYYKQEYLPKGQSPEHYTDMILVELALGDINMQEVAMAKAKE